MRPQDIATYALCLTLAACAGTKAASRGFMAGVVGGPMMVDEYKNEEFQEGSLHSSGKHFAHMTAMITTVPVLWPFTAAYGGASGLYGAYTYWQMDREARNRPGEIKVRSYWRKQ